MCSPEPFKRAVCVFTVFVLANVMYWSDAELDKIETSDINGNGRRILKRLPDSHVFAFALHGGNLYIADSQYKYVGFSAVDVFSERIM